MASADKLLGHIQVPYLLGSDVACLDDVPFLDIPKRYGLHWDMSWHPEFSGLDEVKAALFLQEWLFFGFLQVLCKRIKVSFNRKDFISLHGEGRATICGASFRKYVWFWTAAISPKSLEVQSNVAVWIKSHLEILHKVTQAWTRQTDIQITDDLDLVLFSLTMLGSSLTYHFSEIIRSWRTESPSVERLTWSPSRCIQDSLLKSGWCVGERPNLISRCSPVILLHLSSMNRQRSDKDHSRCGEQQGCLVNQIIPETYKPSHTPTCSDNECRLTTAPVDKICSILCDGDIPLVTFSSSLNATTPELSVHRFPLSTDQPTPTYVAISHVWSDGMGNPQVNGVHYCQLLSIQALVDGLYKNSRSDRPRIPFWIDTLCVPLHTSVRSMAIVRMAKTYFHADKVLVLDNWLRYGPKSLSDSEAIIKVHHSDWNTRLWTFQESSLSRECHFQIGSGGAFALLASSSDLDRLRPVQEISNILEIMSEDEILNDQSASDLLRAITYVDTYIETLCRTQAELPPQSDNEEEQLRLHAIKCVETFDRRANIVKRWTRLRAELPDKAVSPLDGGPFVFGLEQITNDPIHAYAASCFNALHAIYHKNFASRENDRTSGKPRQLDAFGDISLYSRLFEAVKALPGRSTSRPEDGTICLAGILGLDVSSLLEVRIDESQRAAQVERVCVDRMKILLSMINKLPYSILFWRSERLQDDGWKWAPKTFLDKAACVDVATSESVFCTPEGLLGSFPTIRLKLNKFSRIEERFQTLRLQWTVPTHNLSRQSWECLEICSSSKITPPGLNWQSCFHGGHGDLILLLDGGSRLDAVLVKVISYGTKLAPSNAQYLCNVNRVPGTEEPERLEAYVDAEWLRGQEWLVG